MTCENKRLTIKHCLKECLSLTDRRENYDIQSNIIMILGRNTEVRKLMNFLKEKEMFDELYQIDSRILDVEK